MVKSGYTLHCIAALYAVMCTNAYPFGDKTWCPVGLMPTWCCGLPSRLPGLWFEKQESERITIRLRFVSIHHIEFTRLEGTGWFLARDEEEKEREVFVNGNM
uniref:SFRICE_004545 n=1 Tax=Spodoptera frugiperda TaxID=7108 RepID=A0A2H1VDT2_SPOFR